MIHNKTVFAWIFARGGSKGFPGKNLARLDGVPLIGHAVRSGLESAFIDEVFVSTDCAAIAEVAREYGATVPFVRPPELATDEVPERYAWRHAVEWCRSELQPGMDIMVSLPPTVPLRVAADVDRSIEIFDSGDFDTVLSVTRSEAHPSFNLVSCDDAGAAKLLLPPSGLVARRQECRTVYRITGGVYVTNPSFVLRSESFWEGRVGITLVPKERSVDIDAALDLDWARFLLERLRKERH